MNYKGILPVFLGNKEFCSAIDNEELLLEFTSENAKKFLSKIVDGRFVFSRKYKFIRLINLDKQDADILLKITSVGLKRNEQYRDLFVVNFKILDEEETYGN